MSLDEHTPEPDTSRIWFPVVSAFEGALIPVAWLIASLAGVPLFADFHWDVMDALKGGAAAVPLVLFFVWSCQSKWTPIQKVHAALEEFARPVFRGFTPIQLLVVAIIAGVAEETLFRAAIQSGLVDPLGEIGALIAASVLFGLAHLVTPGYAIAAAIIGVYIGWIWIQGGNLLIPIITHAVYDFIALTWFVNKASPVKTD